MHSNQQYYQDIKLVSTRISVMTVSMITIMPRPHPCAREVSYRMEILIIFGYLYTTMLGTYPYL